jgi:hypothetical protein
MPKTQGASLQAIANRRVQVYQLAVRGLSGSAIAASLKVTERTVFRDLYEVKAKLLAEVTAQNAFVMAWAKAELNELWAEGWRLYLQAPQVIGVVKKGKEIKEIREDPTYRKLGSLQRLLQVASEKNRISGLHTPNFTQTVNIESFTFQGVKITNTVEAEDVIRKRGEEMDKLYAAGRPAH